jgi:hypothetical protein
MRHIKLMSVAFVAVVASSALIATAASAAPEYLTCIKANPKSTGDYSDKTCSAASKVAGTGKYERAAWNQGKKTAFKGKNLGFWKNIAINPAKGGEVEAVIECTKEKTAGEITGPKTSKWKAEYKGCTAQVLGGPVECKSPGGKKGTIVTEELNGTLVFLGQPTMGENKRPGIRVKGEKGVLAKYECGGGALAFNVVGEYMATVTGNIESATTEDTITASSGALNGQVPYYEVEAHGGGSAEETYAFEYFGEVKVFHECVAEQLAKGAKSVAEAEALCVVLFKAPKKQAPVSIFSDVTETKTGNETPILTTQVGASVDKGEAVLITTK